MQILCLVVMNYRVKVIIPHTEIWYDSETVLPDYVVRRMIGAEINYVLTNVDRLGLCAIASRRLAFVFTGMDGGMSRGKSRPAIFW